MGIHLNLPGSFVSPAGVLLHPWVRPLRVYYSPAAVTLLLERVAAELMAAFQRLGHEVLPAPDDGTDVILTTAPFGEPLRWRDALYTFMSAAVAMALGMTLILQAMKHGDAGLVAVLSSVSPVLLLPLLWVVYRRRPAAGAWLGAVLAVLGTALVLS